MKPRTVLFAVPWVLLALLASAAQASPDDRFNAAITPTAVQPLTGQVYSVELTNLGSSSHAADNAHVAVPGGSSSTSRRCPRASPRMAVA